MYIAGVRKVILIPALKMTTDLKNFYDRKKKTHRDFTTRIIETLENRKQIYRNALSLRGHST